MSASPDQRGWERELQGLLRRLRRRWWLRALSRAAPLALGAGLLGWVLVHSSGASKVVMIALSATLALSAAVSALFVKRKSWPSLEHALAFADWSQGSDSAQTYYAQLQRKADWSVALAADARHAVARAIAWPRPSALSLPSLLIAGLLVVLWAIAALVLAEPSRTEIDLAEVRAEVSQSIAKRQLAQATALQAAQRRLDQARRDALLNPTERRAAGEKVERALGSLEALDSVEQSAPEARKAALDRLKEDLRALKNDLSTSSPERARELQAALERAEALATDPNTAAPNDLNEVRRALQRTLSDLRVAEQLASTDRTSRLTGEGDNPSVTSEEQPGTAPLAYAGTEATFANVWAAAQTRSFIVAGVQATESPWLDRYLKTQGKREK